MWKKIIEAPFAAMGWLFKNVYGRVVSVLILLLLSLMVNYPIADTNVGIWKVQDTIKPNYIGRDADKGGRVDRDAIEQTKVLERAEVQNWPAFITRPFHRIAALEIKDPVRIAELERETNDKDHPVGESDGPNGRRIKTRYVQWVSQGLNLGLDLRGGMELRYRIQSEEKDVKAEDVAEIIRRRVDAHGLKEPRIQPVGNNGILIQVPGSTDLDRTEIARIKDIVERMGRLEFRVVADEQNNSAILKEAGESQTPPAGWHWYNLNEERDGKMKQDKLLIEDKPQLTGDTISHVTWSLGPKGYEVNVSFNDKSAFWRVTRENLHRRLAIVLDDVRDKDEKLQVRENGEPYGTVKSAPVIQTEIPGDAQITGNFTKQEVEELKLSLQYGSLKANLVPESEQFVGPFQGQKAIEDSQRAIIIGLAAIAVFMAVYYIVVGAVADFALLLNLLLLTAAMTLRGITLTIPGIAGILLTMGMAVDANVLIFERIREELKKAVDKPLLKCMRDGHHRALVTIFDANFTTVITAVILYLFGTGPVKGFAVTLIYGLVISMFTAIVVTRIILEALIQARAVKKFHMMEFVANANIPFISMRKVWIGVSIVLCTASIVALPLMPGKRFGIDFSSGTLVEVRLNKNINADEVRARLAGSFPDAEVQEIWSGTRLGAGSNQFSIRLRQVPEVTVTPASAAPAGQLTAGTTVLLTTNGPVNPKEIERQLLSSGGETGKGAVVTEVSHEGTQYNYKVTTPDTRPEAPDALSSLVRPIFENEMIVGDIRTAFTTGGEPLLAEEGLHVVSQDQNKLVLSVELAMPMKPEDVQKQLTAGGANVSAAPVGALDAAGLSSNFQITGKPDDLPAVKTAFARSKELRMVEPFGNITKIYPAVAKELVMKAAVAVLLSLFAILGYVWFRFEFRFGLGAVVALMHDVTITLGALTLMRYEIGVTVIAALLTIIGYSLNDTIVVFDRIRENRRLIRKVPFPEIVNTSINQTLSRTILTSLTVLIAALSLFIFGGVAIREFAFAMCVGVITGTYSSIFIASPILLMTGEQGAVRGSLGAQTTRTARPLEMRPNSTP